MTESTQLQAANNNNGSTVKMEPLPSIVTSSAVNTTTSTETLSTTNISIMEQHQRQQQQLRTSLVEAQTHPHHQYQQQQYALKWNDYQTSILTSFRHLRDEEDFVDVTLACNHRSFTAHKVVLSACSPYFRKLLKANPCEHPIVILRDVPADDIENLLSFMYNGEVNVGHDHLSDFLKIAHLLQIRGLADVKNNNDNENHNAYTAVFNNGHSNAVKSLSNALINHNTNNNNNNKETTNDNINNKGDTNGSNNNNNNNNGFLASTSCNNSNINKLNFLTAATQALNNNSSSTFPTPTPLAAIAAAAASVCVSSNIMPNNNAVSNFSTNSNSHSNSSESNNKNDSNVNHSNCSNNKNIINTHSNNLNDNIGNNSINRTNDHTSNINDNTEHNNNSNSSTNNNSNSNNHSNINNNISNNNNNNNDISSSNCGKSLTLSTTPAIQELKASAASPVRKTIQNKTNHWDINESSDRNSHLTPPPQKRIKSADLFRAQHGISPERLLIDREFSIRGQHPLTRTRSRETSRDRERERDIHESLLGQALENTNGLQKLHSDISALQAQSAGEDSDGSDTEPSDRGDGQHEGTLDSLDNQRTHAFPNAFLGLQGIPGLLPGPSNMTPNDFVTRRALEMRVRATDPRPCPKCGKIYRSAHTLRTHLEDKHTVCPGYRCVLCGTVAKSRNSLHSHMSRQHRGISTKDLPVLPMPSAFDPDLASRLLAKAGVKISPAELSARASPTHNANNSGSGSGIRGGSVNTTPKLDFNNDSLKDDTEDSDDDPEDLTINSISHNGGLNTSIVNTNLSNELSHYHENFLNNFGQTNTISRLRNDVAAAAAVALNQQQQKELGNVQIPTSTTTRQSALLLDTYLQFFTEKAFGLGMSQEHAATAALHAAKVAQLNVMGHGIDKLPSSLISPQFDLSKLVSSTAAGSTAFTAAATNNSRVTMEPILNRLSTQLDNVGSNSAIPSYSNNNNNNHTYNNNEHNSTNTDILTDLHNDNTTCNENNSNNNMSEQNNPNYPEDEIVRST